jgi:hypothetical protein
MSINVRVPSCHSVAVVIAVGCNFCFCRYRCPCSCCCFCCCCLCFAFVFQLGRVLHHGSSHTHTVASHSQRFGMHAQRTTTHNSKASRSPTRRVLMVSCILLHCSTDSHAQTFRRFLCILRQADPQILPRRWCPFQLGVSQSLSIVALMCLSCERACCSLTTIVAQCFSVGVVSFEVLAFSVGCCATRFSCRRFAPALSLGCCAPHFLPGGAVSLEAPGPDYM